MNPKDVDYFRNKLNQQRDAIARRLGGHTKLEKTGDADDLRDAADKASAFLETEIDDLIADGEDNLLEKIDLALARLDEGSYQDCAGCGGRITVERLKAKPSVSLCIECQRQKEEGG